MPLPSLWVCLVDFSSDSYLATRRCVYHQGACLAQVLLPRPSLRLKAQSRSLSQTCSFPSVSVILGLHTQLNPAGSEDHVQVRG